MGFSIFGLSTTVVFFVISVTLYPMAKYVLPKIKSKTTAAIVHMAYGLLSALILFGKYDTLFCLGMALVSYYCFGAFKPHITSFVAAALVTLSHFIILFRREDWALDMTGITMVMFQKIVSLAFNIDDGKKMANGEKLKRPRWEAVAVSERPSLLFWLAYAFTPYGGISNPMMEYKVFDYALARGTRSDSTVTESDHKKAKFRFFGAFGFAAFVQFVMSQINYDNTYNSEWFPKVPLLIRMVLPIPITTCLALRYFAGWWLVEAGFHELGLSSSGIIPEDELSNLSMWSVLTSTSCDEWMRRWNHTTHLFWKNYLHTRMLNSGFSARKSSMAVFICSMLWHGFRPVYLALLPECFIFLEVDRIWHKKVPYATSSGPIKVLHRFMVIWCMLYTTSSWYFPWIDQFFKIRSLVAFGPTVAYIAIAVVVIFVLKKKPEEKPKAQ